MAQLVHMLGFSRIEMIGQTVGELRPFRDIESNKVMLARLQKDGYVRYENLPLETRSGRYVAVEFVSNVYRAGDHDVIQCNIRDITARRVAELEIGRLYAELDHRVAARTQELQTANQELEAFSYSVSHDLRTPLRHVAAFAELLHAEAESTLSEKSRHYLASITQAITEMGRLIDDLLALSRVGRSDMHKVDIDLEPLVADVCNDFSDDVAARGIGWDIRALPHVQADRALLRLVFVNLIANAVKFCGQCAAPMITVGSLPGSPGETVVFVRGNGVGFDPAYADKLFGVFQRLHSRAEFDGTGVGLANVKRIVSRHGGRVWAKGAVGAGATFYVSLPDAIQGAPTAMTHGDPS